MRKLLVVVKREYLTRVRTRGFVIGTLVLPILIIGFSLVPSLLMMLETDQRARVAVVDLSGVVYPEIKALTQDSLKWSSNVTFSSVEPRSGIDKLKSALSREVDQGDLTAYILIPADVLENSDVEYYARNVSDFRRVQRIESLLSQSVRQIRLERSGLDASLVRGLMRGVDMQTFRVGPEGKEQADTGGTFIITFIMGMALYMMLILYGTFVMRSVIEEKTSRVVEVVVSSLRPFDLMAGKILGVGAVGLTQFAVWTVALVGVSIYASNMAGSLSGPAANFAIPTIPASTYVYFVLFFLLGYLIFSTLYAGVGAIVNSEQEAQSMQFPVIMLLVVPFMLMFFVIGNPDSSAAVILSLVPFFTPILMFTRIAVQTPPWYEIWGSILLVSLSLLGMIWLVGKIYRVGILMYGKRPTLPEVVKWLKYS